MKRKKLSRVTAAALLLIITTALLPFYGAAAEPEDPAGATEAAGETAAEPSPAEEMAVQPAEPEDNEIAVDIPPEYTEEQSAAAGQEQNAAEFGDEETEAPVATMVPAMVTSPDHLTVPKDGDPIPSKEIPADDPRFLDKTWDEVVEQFFSDRRIDPSCVGIAYYNTVTGEEQFLNGDKYFYAASLYKVPMNMYLGEKVYLGEMDMQQDIGGIGYEFLQKSSVQFSSNISSDLIQRFIGTQQEYLEYVKRFYADEGDDFDYAHTVYNTFTARQFLHALKMLYAEPERYPYVLERMKDASPGFYFKLFERRFVIAQKYGYFYEQNLGTLNTIGIIYTDEPIILVMMSRFMPGGTTTLGEFCVRMCDYAQYWYGVHEHERTAAVESALGRVQPALNTLEEEVLNSYVPKTPKNTAQPAFPSETVSSSAPSEEVSDENRLQVAEQDAAAAAEQLEQDASKRRTVIIIFAVLLTGTIIFTLTRAKKGGRHLHLFTLVLLFSLPVIGTACPELTTEKAVQAPVSVCFAGSEAQYIVPEQELNRDFSSTPGLRSRKSADSCETSITLERSAKQQDEN